MRRNATSSTTLITPASRRATSPKMKPRHSADVTSQSRTAAAGMASASTSVSQLAKAGKRRSLSMHDAVRMHVWPASTR